MHQLTQVIPDPEFLLALEPEELAAKILFLLRQRKDPMFHPDNLQNEMWGDSTRNQVGYPRERENEIGLAIVEAWAWLYAQGLIVPAEGGNGQNGWRRLSRRARRIESEADFTNYKIARLLPREILHPKIADPVWRAFMRGEFDVAVLQAMKTVEVYVREASGLGSDAIGVKLMRSAFNPDNGMLTDMTAEFGEREGRSALFAGAIASYKNPHSHRDVNMDNPAEAVEIIFLANHLLRIVDAKIRERETL